VKNIAKNKPEWELIERCLYESKIKLQQELDNVNKPYITTGSELRDYNELQDIIDLKKLRLTKIEKLLSKINKEILKLNKTQERGV
tara:strand:+ start:1743 stop:2000 length:258 start_codon:yes stop_codon:yes gene_type:complete